MARRVVLPFEIRISRVLLVTIVAGGASASSPSIGGVVVAVDRWLDRVRGCSSLVGGAMLALISRTGLMRVPKTITIDDRGITWRGVVLWTHRMPFAELSRVGVASNHGRTAVIGIPAKGADTERPTPPTYDRQAGVFTLIVLSTPGSRSPYSRSADDVVAAVRQAAGSRWSTERPEGRSASRRRLHRTAVGDWAGC